jgi:hypothetical protein
LAQALPLLLGERIHRPRIRHLELFDVLAVDTRDG